ncbi:hypothetical protein TNCT6_57600 [Streptomyces sp. 6-11-2]|nr:hypothetical protein TNCT6_57600 [Streptomyces sp. 6-11-2]
MLHAAKRREGMTGSRETALPLPHDRPETNDTHNHIAARPLAISIHRQRAGRPCPEPSITSADTLHPRPVLPVVGLGMAPASLAAASQETLGW